MSSPSVFARARRHLLDFILPCACLACEEPVDAGRPNLGLCVTCRGRLRQIGSCCAVCATPLDGTSVPAGFRCGDCRVAPPRFTRLLAVHLYEPPLDRVLHHFKFGGLVYLGAQLAGNIAERHSERLARADLIVPVPLHPGRALRRGYNQAREISLPLAARLGRPHADALRRVRPTPAQTGLSRDDRRLGPRGAFRARRRVDLEGVEVVLVDDVVTTGATANEAARALLGAGARRVTLAAPARTPPPGGPPTGGPVT